MIEARQNTRLAVELLVGLALGFFVRQGIGLHLFDRAESTVKAHVLSQVDATHTSPADDLADFVSFA